MKGKIAEIIQAHVDGVISAVMEDHCLNEREFRKSKFPMAVRARTMVIRRLLADGFSPPEICQFTTMKIGMIERRVYPEQRARGNELRRRAYYAKKQAVEIRA